MTRMNSRLLRQQFADALFRELRRSAPDLTAAQRYAILGIESTRASRARAGKVSLETMFEWVDLLDAFLGAEGNVVARIDSDHGVTIERINVSAA